MKIIEKRRLPFESARALAIRENWFENADNDHYIRWLDWCDEQDNIDTHTIYELAEYAVEYSIDYRQDRKEAVENFMYCIANSCNISFEIEEYTKPWRV